MASRRPSEFQHHQLDNPLFRCYSHIDAAAVAFARSIDSKEPDKQLWIKAARIACDPPTWSSVQGLTGREIDALEKEPTQGFWRQTKTLRLTIVSLCFSAVLHGWVQSVSNGANQTMPESLGLKLGADGDYKWAPHNGLYKFASINAITYLTAGAFGCWFSDPLQSSILGRRGAIFASCCLCIAASIGAAASSNKHWWHLLLWRAVLGIGLGAKAAVTPIFGAEVAPAHLRGRLVMNWQLFDAFGIFCGFSANLIFWWTGPLAWRFQMASACIPAGALLVLIYTVPESPRWLLKKGKGKEAFQALCQLRHTPLQAATELFFANAQIQREIRYMRKRRKDAEQGSSRPGTTDPSYDMNLAHAETELDIRIFGQFETYSDAVGRTSYWGRIIQLFRNARTRRAAVAAGVVMLGQQLCGINILAFYSTTFIQDLNNRSSRNLDALWLSWGLGLANFLFTIPAYWLIDKYGRRSLLLVSYPGMILSLFATTMSFLGGTGDHADWVRKRLICVFIYIFVLFYSIGQGPVAFPYASEVFPLFNREAGMSLSVFINLFGAGILTLFAPQAQVTAHPYHDDKRNSVSSMLEHLSPSSSAASLAADMRVALSSDLEERVWLIRQARLVGAFTAFCFASLVLIFFFVPETKLATAREDDDKRVLNYISLEELNQIFSVRTKDCWTYYAKHVGARTINNILYHLRLRHGWLPIEGSMHFWSEKRLDRDSGAGRSSGESEQTEDGHESESTKMSGAVHEEDVSRPQHASDVEMRRFSRRTGSGDEIAPHPRSERTAGTPPRPARTPPQVQQIPRKPLPNLPSVVDTGGNIGFRPPDPDLESDSRPRPDAPSQPDPDAFRHAH